MSNVVNLFKDVEWRYWQKKALPIIRDNHEVCLTIPRQEGKDFTTASIVCNFLFRYNKVKFPMAIVTAETLKQAEEVAYEKIVQWLKDVPDTLLIKQRSQNAVKLILKRPWEDDWCTVMFSGITNSQALRGRTAQLLICSEAAFYPKDVIDQVLLPTLIDNKLVSKAIFISTVNRRNHYWKRMEDYSQPNSEDSLIKTACIKMTSGETGVRPVRMLVDMIKSAKRQGNLPGILQEYFHDPDAVVSGQAPFAKAADWHRKNTIKDSPINGTIFVVFDRGGIGANPTIELGYTYDNKLSVVNTCSTDRNMFDMLDRLVRQYKNNFVKVISPWDCEIPSTDNGLTRNQLLQEHIEQRGYKRVLKIEKTTSKTKSKAELIDRAVELFKSDKIRFFKNSNNLQFLGSMSEVMFKKERASGYIDHTVFSKNGHQHFADAWCYVAGALESAKIKKQSFLSENAQSSHPNFITLDYNGSSIHIDTRQPVQPGNNKKKYRGF